MIIRWGMNRNEKILGVSAVSFGTVFVIIILLMASDAGCGCVEMTTPTFEAEISVLPGGNFSVSMDYVEVPLRLIDLKFQIIDGDDVLVDYIPKINETTEDPEWNNIHILYHNNSKIPRITSGDSFTLVSEVNGGTAQSGMTFRVFFRPTGGTSMEVEIP